MKIAVIGASGWIGGAVVREALARGHEVTAIARDRSKLDTIDGVAAIAANATDPFSIAEAVAGTDAVVSSVSGKSYGVPPHALVATALLEALPRAGVRRLVIVGGAGGLTTAAGTRVIDGPHFHDEWKPEANGQIEALEVLTRRRCGRRLDGPQPCSADRAGRADRHLSRAGRGPAPDR